MICNTLCASFKKSNKTKTQEYDSENDNDYKTNIGNSISSILRTKGVRYAENSIPRFRDAKVSPIITLIH